MTLRDYFAGQALIAILSGDYTTTICAVSKERGLSANQTTAKVAYEFADAMLKEREK